MGRAPCCDKTKVKRGPWSPDEDSLLKDYIHTHGTVSNWIALPRKAGLNRCGKSCRLRWLNYLRPDLIHGGFTEQEDSLICTLYFAIGSRWSVIASKLPGRTDNDVKNYWNTKLKKKIMAGKVRGFEGGLSYSNVGYNMSDCIGPQEPDPTQFVQVKQEQGISYGDDRSLQMPYFSGWEGPIQDPNWNYSEVCSSRCTSSDDQNSSWGSVHTDDFWLGLLQVDQSTFMPGSSSSSQQLLDGSSVFPNQF